MAKLVPRAAARGRVRREQAVMPEVTEKLIMMARAIMELSEVAVREWPRMTDVQRFDALDVMIGVLNGVDNLSRAAGLDRRAA